MKQTIGVLSLQGAFEKHRNVLSRLKIASKDVRYPGDLDGCDGLIIPGGESTTISDLIDYIGMRAPLLKFAEKKPVLGTCTGMILMARTVNDPRVQPLNLMNIEIARNAYGRQVDSFVSGLEVQINGKPVSLKGVFIRAPRIRSTGEEVEVLGMINGEPIFVRQNRHLATSFHPELSDTTAIHEYFLSLVREPTLVYS